MIQYKQYKLIIYTNMVKIFTELEKRGHRVHLTLNGSEDNSWVGMMTSQDWNWKTPQYRVDLGEELESRGLFNSLLYSLLRNGYKLISIK